MQKIKSQNLKFILLVAAVMLVGVGVAYAALSTTLNITFGSVTQSSLVWSVVFDTQASGGVVAAGTSATGRTCGTATVTADSVTLADTTLSKPDDKCTYTLVVANTGTIDATLASITPTAPTATPAVNPVCTTASGGTMECGNIKYQLTTDPAGTTALTTGGTLATGATQTMYLVVSYIAEGVQASAITQTGAKFTLVYNQV